MIKKLHINRSLTRFLATLALAIFILTPGWGQTTFTWNFGTSSPGSASPSSGTLLNLTVGNVSIGNTLGTVNPFLTTTSGSSGYTGASGSYNAGNAARIGALSTGSSGSAYFEFTLTPATGYSVSLSSISFGTRSTSTAPQAYTLRSSADSYASDIATGTMSATSTWQLRSNTGLTFTGGANTAVTFRLYGYNGSGSPSSNTINWRIDDLSIIVNVASSGGLTPPSLSADATNNNVDNDLDITFTDDETWRAAVTAVKIGGIALTVTTDYVLSAGNLKLKPSGLNTLLTTSGSKNVTVEATNYNVASVTQQINPGADVKLEMKTQPAAPATNGAVLATQPAVYIQDQYGNTTTSAASVTAAVGAGSWTIGGTTLKSGVSGTATFTDLTATSLAAVSGATITFTSGTLASVTSSTFNIPAPAPVITVGSISGFVTQAINTVSPEKTYTVSGINLTADIVITPPAGFEISITSGSGFVGSASYITLVQSGGSVASTTIYVRFAPTLAQAYSGNITHTSTGATTQNVAVSGTGYDPNAPKVVISQVYGGGGNSGATYQNDYVELFNAGLTGQNLNGWSVQQASATGSTWAVINLTNVTLNPGQYYLIKMATGGAVGIALPTPDVTNTTPNIGVGGGKIALVNNNTQLTGTCPTVGIVDFIGFSNTANCYETAYGPAHTSTTATIRISGGCSDTDNNSSDFVSGTPNPRNTSNYNLCATPTAFNVTGGGAYCSGGLGVSVGLSNSQLGVSYQLYIGAAAAGTPISGTGSSISFGLQTTVDIYTVKGTSSGGITDMTGNATITEDPLPAAAGSITGSAAVTEGNTAIAYSVGTIADATSYNWVYTGSGATITNVSGNSVTIDFAIGATSGNLTVNGVNTCGNGAVSPAFAITVNPASGPCFATEWTGAVSDNWATLGNWTNCVPIFWTSVTIPAGTPENPVIYEGPGAPAECAALTINSGAILTINPGKALTVNGTLTNSAGNSGLVIKSGGSLISTSENVAATVERAIEANDWHLISSPMTNASSQLFQGHYLQRHTESTNLYTDLTLPYETLTAGKGFALWGDLPTASFTGNLNAIDVGIGTTSNYADLDPINNKGWNLVGNPFASSIDWDAITKPDEINDAIYIHVDGSTWATYGGGVGVNAGGTKYIASCQGFFVRATANVTLTIPASSRVHNNTAFFKNSDESVSDLVRLEISGNGYKDESVVRLKPEATAEFDGNWDAYKLFGSVAEAPQIYTFGPTPLAINAFRELTTVPVGVRAGTSGTYTIAATEINDLQNVKLEDTKTGIMTDLTSKSYTFEFTAGENESRFKLHFTALGVDEKETTSANIYSYQQTVYVNLADNTNGDIYIYNLAGQLVTAKESASGSVRIGLSSTGVYMVKVVTQKETLTQKVVIR
jgi:hypothetical protein